MKNCKTTKTSRFSRKRKFYCKWFTLSSIVCFENKWLILPLHFSAHKKFKALAPEKVGHNKNAKLSMAKVLQYPELRVNPFGDQICKVFSSSNDGDCTFEDFLDMMSVFSDAAPRSVKAEHAFRIFGNKPSVQVFFDERAFAHEWNCKFPFLYRLWWRWYARD